MWPSVVLCYVGIATTVAPIPELVMGWLPCVGGWAVRWLMLFDDWPIGWALELVATGAARSSIQWSVDW